ncbi:hypothetical protein PAMP_019156 [Pampus punctatissimus]
MSVTALFRGKWGPKSQETPAKHAGVVVQQSHEEEDEDGSKVGFSREPIRRNSRFYRSMRKKRLASSEQSESSARLGLDHSPQNRREVASSSPTLPQKSPLLLGSRRTVLPSNDEANSRHALYNKDAVNRRREGVGGLSVDISAASNSQNRDFTADMITYRTHAVHSGDIKKLSEKTAAACTVQEVKEKSMSSQQPSSDGEIQDNVNLRLPSCGDGCQTIYHSLKIVKNTAFLYQEYRDTSKQQEIEQRRQRENLFPEVMSGTVVPGSGVTSPPVLQLQLRNSARTQSLWQNLEAVLASGLLTQLPQKEIIMQEAMFELVTSEASYYKSLEILESHFLHNPGLIKTLSQSDMHFLFSNIEEVMKASERFLMDLEHRIEKSILISDVCDIVYHHAVEHFSVFIKYVINQNILKKAEEKSEREENAIKAHQQLEQIVKECNEGVRKMSRTEELISIEKTLEFKSKSVPIISHSRWLLKKGEVQLMSGPKSTRTTRSRKLYQPVYLFLFNNLLLVTKRSSSGDKFQVLDSCMRAMLRTEDLEDQGQLLANVFNLKLLENQEERTVSYMLKTSSMSDKLRWICALTPNRRTRFMSTSAHQPGWMMGERLHDGERGWFPSRVVEEIQSKEVRAQNLREAFRIQQAQEGGGGPQTGARIGLRVGRRTPNVSNFSNPWMDEMGESSEVKQ